VTVRVSRFHRRFTLLDRYTLRLLSVPENPSHPTPLMCAFMVIAAAINDGLEAIEPGSQIRFGYCDGGTVRLVGPPGRYGSTAWLNDYWATTHMPGIAGRERLRSAAAQMIELAQDELAEQIDGGHRPRHADDWATAGDPWTAHDGLVLRVGYRVRDKPPVVVADVRWSDMTGARAQLMIRGGRLNLPVCEPSLLVEDASWPSAFGAQFTGLVVDTETVNYEPGR
jgi:hypothetical protein